MQGKYYIIVVSDRDGMICFLHLNAVFYVEHLLCIFRDFMDKSMDRTKHMLYYLYPILGKAQPEVREYMERYRNESTHT